MKVVKGIKAVTCTFQDQFPQNTICECGGFARIAFVAIEEDDRFPNCVADLHENQEHGKFWPHDCIAVAVYFCEECAKPVTLWNQA